MSVLPIKSYRLVLGRKGIEQTPQALDVRLIISEGTGGEKSSGSRPWKYSMTDRSNGCDEMSGAKVRSDDGHCDYG